MTASQSLVREHVVSHVRVRPHGFFLPRTWLRVDYRWVRGVFASIQHQKRVMRQVKVEDSDDVELLSAETWPCTNADCWKKRSDKRLNVLFAGAPSTGSRASLPFVSVRLGSE